MNYKKIDRIKAAYAMASRNGMFGKNFLRSLLIACICVTIPDRIIAYAPESFLYWVPPHALMFTGGIIYGAYEAINQYKRFVELKRRVPMWVTKL